MNTSSLRLAQIYDNDADSNGPGLRMVIFAQGCKHHCKNCFNPETWDFNKGKEYSIKEVKKRILNNSVLIDGITLSGGDPFFQPFAFSQLAIYAHSLNLNVWSWTGFTFEQLRKLCKMDKNIELLINNIDILVDGKYEEELKVNDDEREKYPLRGSKNQRIIDVKKSLITKKIVVLKKI
ncbi:MAG: anaerobic ribonucleoside-triphosphate reductase activating protein [Mycoplasmataceae bacterium]|nr:anaerobic ribonucleoside-triphosphate reductase activating protein [Mycoplasmataceae bacterium]